MNANKSHKSNRYKRLFVDIFILCIGTVLAKAIQFLLMPLYTSVLSTETYGSAELVNNLSELLFPIATLCIYESAFRFAVEPDINKSALKRIVLNFMGKSIFLGFLFFLILRIFFNFRNSFYLFFILYAYSLKMCIGNFVRGCGLIKAYAFSGVLNAVSLAILSVFFLSVLNLNGEGYLLSIALSYLLTAVFLLCCYRTKEEIPKENLSDKALLKKLLKYSIPLVFYNTLYWFITISGRYILLLFSDSSTVGVYVSAVKISAIINLIQQAVYGAVQISSASAYGQDDAEKYYSNILNTLTALYFVFGGVAILASPIIAGFTLKNDFSSASVYLPLIMLSAIFNCISSLQSTMYSTYKKTERMIKISLMGAVINVALCFILTPRLNIWGICISSAICYLTQAIYKIFDCLKFCDVKYNWANYVVNFCLLFFLVVFMSFSSCINFKLAIILYTFMLIINFNIIRKFVNTVFSRN